MRREALNWFEGAKVDLEEAEGALNHGRPNWALFAAQQAVEKALKASTIVLRRRRPLKTNDLVELYRETRLKLSERLVDAMSELTPYYSMARYPNAGLERPWENISTKTARRLFEAAKKVVGEVGKKAHFEE